MAQLPKFVHMLLQVDGEEAQLRTAAPLTPEFHIQLSPAWMRILDCKTVELRHADGVYYSSLFDERGCSTYSFDCIRSVLQQADTFGTAAADPICMKGEAVQVQLQPDACQCSATQQLGCKCRCF